MARQYRACRRNKRNTRNQLAFEICFVTNGPKPREVFAADFRDRVVHHVLVSARAGDVGQGEGERRI